MLLSCQILCSCQSFFQTLYHFCMYHLKRCLQVQVAVIQCVLMCPHTVINQVLDFAP